MSHELFLPFLRIHIHGTDFVELEALSVLTDAGLLKEDGARGFLFDLRADDGNQDQGEDTADETANDIKQSFDDHLQWAGIVSSHGQDIISANLFHEALATGAGNRKADMNRDRHFAALFNQLGYAGLFVVFFCFLGTVGIFDIFSNGFIGSGLQI